jgi:hypothetical protein
VARSLWTGSLSFGLVNVPVSLVAAVQDLDLHFHQVHEKDGAPIEIKAGSLLPRSRLERRRNLPGLPASGRRHERN